MKRAEPEAIEIPGLDVAEGKALQPDETRGAAALDALDPGPVGVVCLGPAGGPAERVDCALASGSQARGAGIFHGDDGTILALRSAGCLLR